MPPRTNDFQQLVALIEQSLAPKGAKITQSAEVAVKGLSTLREVDVLIDGEYGEYKLKIAIEAKDEGRKISVPTFESYLAKYRGECRVMVDKFVIVSRRGFTKGVIEKAAATDVELLTLEQAKEKKWETLGPPRFEFRVAPHIHGVEFDPPIHFHKPAKAYKEARLMCSKEHDHGSIAEVAKCFFFHQWLPRNESKYQEAEKGIRELHNGQGILSLSLPMKNWRVKYNAREYAIRQMKINVHVVSAVGSASHRAFTRHSTKSGSKTIHHIQGVAGGKKLSLAIPVVELSGMPAQMSPEQIAKLSPEERQKALDEKIKQIFPNQIVLNIADATKPATKGKPPRKRPAKRQPKRQASLNSKD